MNTKSFKVLLLAVAVSSLSAQLNGQTFTALYHCTTGADGNLYNGVVLAGDRLYGTSGGGSCCAGLVFSVNTNGTDFRHMHAFDYISAGGRFPGALVLSDGALYGYTTSGGANGKGTIFSMHTDGSGFTPLLPLTASGGAATGGLLLEEGRLYGNTSGSNGQNATVFSLNTNGTDFQILHTMAAGAMMDFFTFTNADGSHLEGKLVLSGDTLYGTASRGGRFGNGTLFSLKTNGADFTVLRHFAALSGSGNLDGALPQGGLVLANGLLYGTTAVGGANGGGTIFSIRTNGTGFTVLRHLSEAVTRRGQLLLSGSTLYGTAREGGTNSGTIFSIKTNGTAFAVRHAFGQRFSGGGGGLGFTNRDGASPMAGLIASGNTLYGTTSEGGYSGYGTIFSLTVPVPPSPQLTRVQVSGSNVVLNAAGGVAGETYQALMSTDVVSSIAAWTTVASRSLPTSGNFTMIVTNGFTALAPQRFYLLRMQAP